MAYDITALNSTNTNNLLDVLVALNTAGSQGGVPIFGTSLLFVIWLFFFMAFKKEDSVKDFAMSSFLTSIIGVLMLLAGLLPWGIVIIPVFVLFISLMVIIFT
jgi:hypothetical protein